jgi:hypothetical protein
VAPTGVDERGPSRVCAVRAVVGGDVNQLALGDVDAHGPGVGVPGNCASGCTVNLATTVRDASSDFTTVARLCMALDLELGVHGVGEHGAAGQERGRDGRRGRLLRRGRQDVRADQRDGDGVATACLVASMAQGPTSSPSAKRSSCAAWRTRAVAPGRLTSSCAPACRSSTVIGAWTPTSPRSSGSSDPASCRGSCPGRRARLPAARRRQPPASWSIRVAMMKSLRVSPPAACVVSEIAARPQPSSMSG